MKVPAPLGPRPECLADGRYVLRAEHPGGSVLVVYDPQRQAAATYHLAQEIWRIQVPISLGEYLDALRSNGFTLPESSDLQTWLDAVAELAGNLPN